MKKNIAVRYTVLLASIGIVVTALSGYVMFNTQTTYNRNLPYVKLGDNLKNRTTQAHLWFEEAMAGDQSLNFERDVIPLLTSSRNILQKAYDREETELGKFNSTDEETLAILKEAIIAVEKLSESARNRWTFKQKNLSSFEETDSGEDIGGTLDQEFDAAYEELQRIFDRITAHVGKKVEADSAFLSALSWVSLVLISVFFAVLSFFVYRILKKNERFAQEGKRKLEEESERVNKLSAFIASVSAGDYSIEIDSTDELSTRLLNMRDILRKNAEEDQRRNWATSGQAQIGEILRASDNIAELYDSIITFVVKYTKSNQGGLFLLNEDNDDDKYLELVACYAFERKKFITKRIEPGQGLVGQCYLEGATIHLREIPQAYVHITSGLGGATPNSLMVIPIKVDEHTYGVIELASFKKYEAHEIALVEKFAESIGSSVSSIRINERTKLLLEKTQQQTEEMRAQEEEMRQNMEELEATQEEMRRKEAHVQELLQAEKVKNDEHTRLFSQLSEREKVLNLSTILSEADAAGTITYVNDKLCEVAKYTREEMLGKGHNLFRHPDMPAALFKIVWETIKDQKKVFRGIVKNRAKDNTHYWVDATIVPVIENGVLVKYVSARYHITDDQVALQLYNKQAERLGLPML
jgi:PAS domain S-box-containing protein